MLTVNRQTPNNQSTLRCEAVPWAFGKPLINIADLLICKNSVCPLRVHPFKSMYIFQQTAAAHPKLNWVWHCTCCQDEAFPQKMILLIKPLQILSACAAV